MEYTIIRSDELTHHGILGQKWGVRRFQNPDGTLTTKGKQRLNASKARAMDHLQNRVAREKRRAEDDKANIADLKKNGVNSEYAKTLWDMTSEEERSALAERGGYKETAGVYLDALFGVDANRNTYGRKQLVKEEIKDLEASHARHIERAKKFTNAYNDLSMQDVDKMAEEYGYREARRRIRNNMA